MSKKQNNRSYKKNQHNSQARLDWYLADHKNYVLVETLGELSKKQQKPFPVSGDNVDETLKEIRRDFFARGTWAHNKINVYFLPVKKDKDDRFFPNSEWLGSTYPEISKNLKARFASKDITAPKEQSRFSPAAMAAHYGRK